MFVRTKRIGTRRYVYLVEGRLEKDRVKQSIISYLGPLTRLVVDSVPTRIMRQCTVDADWKAVNMQIQLIPLELDEMLEVRRRRFAKNISSLNNNRPVRRTNRNNGKRERIPGELDALIKISKKRFDRMFKLLPDGSYLMK